MSNYAIAEPFRETVVEILYALLTCSAIHRQSILSEWLARHPNDPARDLLWKVVAMKDPRVLEMRVADRARVSTGDSFWIVDAALLPKQGRQWLPDVKKYIIPREPTYELLKFLVP